MTQKDIIKDIERGRFTNEGIDKCEKCGSTNTKRVDEPNGGGIICNNCKGFKRCDGVFITHEEFLKNLQS